MRLPILLCVVILCLVMSFAIHRGKEEAARQEDDFWEREQKANSTRRKSLDDLNYITIPVDRLPMNLHMENDNIKECTETIVELAKSPIVNLTGISNTDLKLRYGAPNIDQLVLFDQRYTTLVSTLQKWAQSLFDLGESEAAVQILEFAVSTGSDVSGSYRLLADIYLQQKENGSDPSEFDARISQLISSAEKLNSPMKRSILEYLGSVRS